MSKTNIKVSIKPNGKRVVLKKKKISTNSFDSQSQLSNVSEVYKKMSHVEHVLEKPDSYVGSTEMEETEQYVINDKDPSNINRDTLLSMAKQYCMQRM